MDDDAIGTCRYFVTYTGVKLPLTITAQKAVP